MGRLQKYPHAVYPGAEFGRLEILGPPFRTILHGMNSKWYCVVKCKCGHEPHVLPTSSVTSGTTTSCGCFKRETTSRVMSTHRGSATGLYFVWHDIKRRCLDPRRKSYADYGGRGITVCDAWLASFEVFRDWAMSHGYQPELDIDRRDNAGPYSPDNCRFVTRQVNSRNTRRNQSLEVFGETKCLIEWSEDPRCAVGYSTLRDRFRQGWDPHEAVTVPATSDRRRRRL